MIFFLYLRLVIATTVSNFVTGARVFALLATLPTLIVPAISAPLTPGNAIPLTLADKTSALISISQNSVVAQLSSGKKLTLINGISKVPEYARDIWIEDFNFDGYKDIAITTSIDAFSNDEAYTILTWENGLRQFVPMGFRTSLSNIEVLPRRREIRSSYQSGDFWTEVSYRFNHRTPYLYSKSQLIVNNVWHTTIYNQQGQPIRSLVSNDGRTDRPPQPVLLTVSSSVAPLYRQPVPSSILSQQLSRGDTVTILDFKRGMGRLNWVNVRSKHNNQMLQGWILLSNLLQG